MNKKIFLSIILLTSAYNLLGSAVPTPIEQRKSICSKLLSAAFHQAKTYRLQSGYDSSYVVTPEKSVFELSQAYANFKCFDFEEQTTKPEFNISDIIIERDTPRMN